MIFKDTSTNIQVLSSADALIQCGLIRSIITDDKRIVDAPLSSFEKIPSDVSILSIDEAEFNSVKNARESAVFLTNYENLEKAVNIFKKIGIDTIPYLHINSDIQKTDIVDVISNVSAVSSYYEVTADNIGIQHSDRHADYDVSVIVPVYGVAAYVEKCAISLRDQKFNGRYEVLFVDDGGKDNSVEIINKVIEGCPHLKVLSKPNGGAASARNYGIARAKGQYIAFVDGDDYVSHDYVDAMFRAAILNNADISQAEFCHVNASSGEISKHVEWFGTHQGNFSPVSSPAYHMMLQTPGIWRRLYSRKLLDKFNTVFNEDFRRHDDLPFNIEVLANASSIAITRTPVYYYLLGRDGQDVGATDERLFIHFRLFDYTNERITRRYWDSSFFHTYIITMCSHHLWAYDRIEDKLKPQYLRGLAQQVFGSDGPIGLLGRLKILTRHFGSRKLLILKAAILSRISKGPLPSDI